MALGIKATLQALRGGDTVFVTNPDPFKAAERPAYFLTRAARRVTQTAFERLSPELEPVEDGLFQGASQSFRLREPR